METIDIVNELTVHKTKRYATRNLADIDMIVVHHTVSPADADVDVIAKYHVNKKGWPGIAYHYVIPGDGLVYMTNYARTISYHAYSVNEKSLGIALQGDFTKTHPTKEQKESLEQLLVMLRDNLPYAEIVPHTDAGKSKTACPGATWKEWLPDLIPSPDPQDKFTVVWSISRQGLVSLVNQYERDGWWRDGGVFITDGDTPETSGRNEQWNQAMVWSPVTPLDQ